MTSPSIFLMFRFCVLLLFSIISFSSCSVNSSESKTKLLDEFFEIVQEHSILADSSEMHEIKAWAYEEVKITEDHYQCYTIIDNVFSKIGDRHSVILSPSDIWYFNNEGGQGYSADDFAFEGYLLHDSTAYLKLYGADPANNEGVFNYADSLQAIIRSLDSENCKGWILDLRENDGGDFDAMLMGLGPLLGEGGGIYLINNKGDKKSFIYQNGRAVKDTYESYESINPYELIDSDKPIAILTGGKTGSAGEALVVAFHGRDNTRFFGRATYGLTTGMDVFQLKDGSMINLATSYFMDKNGIVYKNKIWPDIYVRFVKHDSDGQQTDSVIVCAQEWINDYKRD